MHACFVIPEQPREDFILGLTDGFKMLAVETFYFQTPTCGMQTLCSGPTQPAEPLPA